MIAEVKTMSGYKYCEKTFQNSIGCVGVGVHSGKKANLTFKPAPVGTGIEFHRVDITDKNNVIPAPKVLLRKATKSKSKRRSFLLLLLFYNKYDRIIVVYEITE